MTATVVQHGWSRHRLGHLFVPVSATGHSDVAVLSVYRDYGVIPKESRSDNFNRTPENLGSYQLVQPKDLVVNRMKAWQGSLGISSHRGIVSPDYEVLRPTSNADSRFVHALLRSSHVVGEYGIRSTGIRPSQWRLYWDQMKTIEVALPTLREQRAIADYLDRETAQIDALIGKQERLIDTLRERRAAVIARTLLCGIDTETPMSADGAEPYGPIPAHWRVVPTRHLCHIATGDEDSGNAVEDGEYPFYVRGREILRSNRFTFDCEAVMTPGDGQGGTGKVFHYFDGRFVAHQRVYVFTDFVGVLGWYFYYFLSTFLRPVALAGSNTVTMESLRRPLLADFKIAVPPLDEQRRITDYLDRQTSRLDALIATVERFIEVSKERRSALITAAVTGQIDVRRAVRATGAHAPASISVEQEAQPA